MGPFGRRQPRGGRREAFAAPWIPELESRAGSRRKVSQAPSAPPIPLVTVDRFPQEAVEKLPERGAAPAGAWNSCGSGHMAPAHRKRRGRRQVSFRHRDDLLSTALLDRRCSTGAARQALRSRAPLPKPGLFMKIVARARSRPAGGHPQAPSAPRIPRAARRVLVVRRRSRGPRTPARRDEPWSRSRARPTSAESRSPKG